MRVIVSYMRLKCHRASRPVYVCTHASAEKKHKGARTMPRLLSGPKICNASFVNYNKIYCAAVYV